MTTPFGLFHNLYAPGNGNGASNFFVLSVAKKLKP